MARTDYLCIEPYLVSILGCRALSTAFEIGLIDRLEQVDVLSLTELRTLNLAMPLGLDWLLAELHRAQVLRRNEGGVALMPAFRRALAYRDLLRVKLDFAHFAAHDYIDHYTAMIRDPGAFMSRASMFRLFSYDRCFELTAENLQHTRRWVRVTTALTRYEAPVCFAHYDLGPHRRMLDVGGNSGEFAWRACCQQPGLEATVVDLPVVCEVGRQHLAVEPEGSRVQFHPANALIDPLPTGRDLISFKSVLHDWPQAEATQLLTRAIEALPPGGSLLIFERTGVDFSELTPTYGMLPLLLFFHNYRDATFYTEVLATLGMVRIEVRRIELDMPFWLITANKPGP